MGLSVYFSGAADGPDGPFDLATARGWQLVAEWAAGRPNLPALRSLAETGTVAGTDALGRDLAAAGDAPPAVRHTLANLAEWVGVGDPAETATVTDGDAPGGPAPAATPPAPGPPRTDGQTSEEAAALADWFGGGDGGGRTAFADDPARHPHQPPGSPAGGQFAPTGGAGKAEAPAAPAAPAESFPTPEAEAEHVAKAIEGTAAFKAGEKGLAALRSAYMAKDKGAFVELAALNRGQLRAVLGSTADAAVEDLAAATGRPPEKLRAVAVKARQMADELAGRVRSQAREWTARDVTDFPDQRPPEFTAADVHAAYRDTVADLTRDDRGDIKAGAVSDILERHFLGAARTPDQRDLAELSPFYEKAPAERRAAATRVQAIY